MPTKKKGGGKKKKRGKNPLDMNKSKKNTNRADFADGQLYARVVQRCGGAKGSAMLEVECSDSKVRKARIPGAWHRRVWINTGDYLRVYLPQEFTVDEKCQIVELYDDTDISRLKNRCNTFMKFSSVQFDTTTTTTNINTNSNVTNNNDDDIPFEFEVDDI